jgi:hypothetical protein
MMNSILIKLKKKIIIIMNISLARSALTSMIIMTMIMSITMPTTTNMNTKRAKNTVMVEAVVTDLVVTVVPAMIMRI